jgi:Tfp pilus assembly protein PilN
LLSRFSLLITIISIALVAALALAALYYGGSAFNKGSAAAQSTQLLNESQQLLRGGEMLGEKLQW